MGEAYYDKPPFGEHVYVLAQRFGEAHASLFGNVFWLSVFLGASRTPEQYRALLDDVDDLERSAAELCALLRTMIHDRVTALEAELDSRGG